MDGGGFAGGPNIFGNMLLQPLGPGTENFRSRKIVVVNDALLLYGFSNMFSPSSTRSGV